MSRDAVLARSADLRLSFVLPGSWAPIPLDSEQASDAQIARLVKARIPRRDELAQLRRETRDQLRSMAAAAREVDAVFLALSLEILPGVPFAASIVAAYVDAPAADDDDQSIAELLLRSSPGGELVEFDHGPGVRGIEVSRAGQDDAARDSVDLRYVVTTPSPDRWLEVVTDIPLDLEVELVVELFDAIVGSIRWGTTG